HVPTGGHRRGLGLYGRARRGALPLRAARSPGGGADCPAGRGRGGLAGAASNLGRVADWIDLLDPTPDELEKALPEAVHERALELLCQPARHDDEPRPRLESHDDYVFGVMLVPVCVREEDRVFYQEVDFVATRERLV